MLKYNAYLKRFANLKKGLRGLVFKLNNLFIFKYALGRQKNNKNLIINYRVVKTSMLDD